MTSLKYYPLQKRYPIGSVVCDRRGYIQVKSEKRKWIPQSHLVAELKGLARPNSHNEGKPIQKNERVFHISANKQNNRPENLVVIEIRLTKYNLLPSSRCLYLPDSHTEDLTQALNLAAEMKR